MDQYLLFLIALVPIVWLMVSLGKLKIPGYISCPVAFGITLLRAIFIWKMPVLSAVTAGLEGAAMAIWPIVIVTIAAVFTYNLSNHTQSMEIIKKMMTTITNDNRILVLLLAWGFSGFLEAIAGFGTAVAIPASILIAIGFEPVFAAIICLVANTTPTAFGALGLPVATLAKLVNLDVNTLSYAVTLQLLLLIILMPFGLVLLTGKSVKAVKGVFGITLAAGLSFALPQVFIAKYLGAELPAMVGSLVCMIVVISIAKIFYKNYLTADRQTRVKKSKKVNAWIPCEEHYATDCEVISKTQMLKAWIPFILVFLFVILTSSLVPAINKPLSAIKTSLVIHQAAGAKPYTFVWLASPGTLIMIASVLGGLIQGAKFGEIVQVFVKTCQQLWKTALTIISIVAMAKVMGYSGMTKDLAVVLVAVTGNFYPLIAPLIGALGTFITGSDTSANVLFGGLQVEVANSLKISPFWLAAMNTSGATAGKMISPQSIAVAAAATGLAGSEGKILNATVKICLGYIIILGLLAYFARTFFGF